LFGATFLVLAWDLAQSVVPSVVIPVGIPTAFAGAPFFLYLLYWRGGLRGGRISA
jgi:iron complex transport system permease protein